MRLRSFLHEAQSGATAMTGRSTRAVNPDNPHDVGPISGRFGGGIKKMFPELAEMPESPSRIAEAIIKDQGNPLYKRVLAASKEDVDQTHGEQIEKAVKSPSRVLEIIDEIREYGQPVPKAEDISFDFGANIRERLNVAETETRTAISEGFRSIAKGETLGACLPVELMANLVKFGAIKVAKGGVGFDHQQGSRNGVQA